MTTLGGVTISDNMYLDGVLDAPLSGSTQKRLLGGGSVVFIQPQIGGRKFTLGTINGSVGTQGLWCQQTIEDLKVFESNTQSIVLDYRGDLYDVVITKMQFTPFQQNQLESPTKPYTGTITLIEV